MILGLETGEFCMGVSIDGTQQNKSKTSAS